jgi:hypothetical protein
MFRLFLRKKLLSGDEPGHPKAKGKGKAVDLGSAPDKADAVRQRNRRVFTRYAVDHKHLTLMNEQDILLVREISAKGFSTEVSPRGYERLVAGDVYDARIRYVGEIYDLQSKVTWKHDGFVGFEIVKAGRETLVFIKRLLRPIEIAFSLQPVEAAFLANAAGASGKTWLHGDEESDLYVWHDPETSELTAWQLAVGPSYVEWNERSGLTTGSLSSVQGREALLGANLQGLTHRADAQVDPQKRQFAVDVIMALQAPVRDELLETVTAS